MALLYTNTRENGEVRTQYISMITFVLCCLMVSSSLIYIDSSSIYTWNAETEVGPATYVISGESVHEYIDEFRNVPGIVSAEIIELCWCELVTITIPPVNYTASTSALSNNQEQPTYEMHAPFEMPPIAVPATAAYLSPSFLTSFPELYATYTGRLPNNDSEIALAYWLAARFQASPGTQINYTHGSLLISTNVTVVGIFRLPVTNNSLELHYIQTDVIVTAGLLDDRNYASHIYADIDRSLISPQNPKSALSYLADLDERLRRVDPEFRVSKQWTMFYVDDLLATGISAYMVWLNNVKSSQMLRSGGFLFLGLIVSSVGVNFSIRTKKIETEILRARGASSKRIIFAQYRDILLMTTLTIPLGLFGGFVVSRFGLICSSFFLFNFSKMSELPFLLTAETIVITIIVTFLTPILMIINQTTTEKIKSSSFVAGSSLAIYTRKVHNIRWELLMLLASVFLLGSIIQQGGLVTQTSNFKIALIAIPTLLSLSLGSLAIKGIKPLSSTISRILSRIFGKIPSFIGVRRIGSQTKFTGPSILVLVLTVSLTWSAVITNYTISSTAQGHTRFAIGGDVAFKLDTIDTSNWEGLAQNVTNYEFVESSTQVIIRTLYMTSSASSAAKFVSIKPSELLEVGFDSAGIPLEHSPLSSLLKLLDITPSGVVITSDLSVRYGIETGDTLRACTINGTEFTPHPFTIIGIADSLPDSLVTESGYTFLASDRVGLGRVWVNSEYIEPLLSDVPITSSLLCIRMTDIGKTDQLIESVIDSGGLSAIDGFGIATVNSEIDATVHDEMYLIERSIDTMLVFMSLFSTIVIFVIFSIENKIESLKQNAILKTLGAENSTLRAVNVSEMLGLILIALFVSLFVSPVFIISSIMVYLIDFGAKLFLFPSPILIATPWSLLLIILVVLVITIVFISYVSVTSESRIGPQTGSFRNSPFESAEWRDA